MFILFLFFFIATLSVEGTITHLARMRDLDPRSLFNLEGVRAQGLAGSEKSHRCGGEE